MKYLVVSSLLLFVLLLIYLRIKPYLTIARRVVGAVRGAQEGVRLEDSASQTARAKAKSEKLVRCQTCQVLLPASRAIALPRASQAAFCSTACLEKAAQEAPK